MPVELDRTASDFDNEYIKCSSCNRKVYGFGYNGLCPSCGAPISEDE